MRTDKLTPRRSEEGSVIIAMSVIMILGALSTAVLARSLTTIRSARQNQDFNTALGGADAGISDALFRLDQAGSANTGSFCVGGAAGACTFSSVPGSPGTQYTARAVDANTFTVLSKGIINGRPHAAQATLTRSLAYPFAIFGKTSVHFNGNGAAIYPKNADGSIATGFSADVGTSGTIDCHGGGHDGDHQVYLSGGGAAGCPNAQQATITYDPLDPVSAANCPSPNNNNPPVPCAPSTAGACPFSGNVPNNAFLTPGAYICTGNLTFNGTVNVPTTGGAVQIYMLPASGTSTMTFAGATVNGGGMSGDPTRLQIYMAGGGTINPGNGSSSGNFTGVLYAPSASLSNNGGSMTWTGAMVLNTLSVNGNPNFTFNYDARVRSLGQADWQTSDYTEVPSNSVTIP